MNTYQEIAPHKILVTFGPCNWTTECQKEDAKRKGSVVMIRYMNNVSCPQKCPACERELKIERFFIEETV